MGNRVTFSFREEEKDLYEWMEQKHEEGDFRTRSDVIVKALGQMRKRDEKDPDKSEWKT